MFVSRERVATGLTIPCRCHAVGIVAGQVSVSISVGPSIVPDSRWRGLFQKVEIIKCLGGHSFRLAAPYYGT